MLLAILFLKPYSAIKVTRYFFQNLTRFSNLFTTIFLGQKLWRHYFCIKADADDVRVSTDARNMYSEIQSSLTILHNETQLLRTHQIELT